MAISIKEFRQMQKDIREIKRQLARRRPKRKNGARKPAVASRRLKAKSERERVTELLRRNGMQVELPPEAQARAARWRALPEEEKKRVWDEFFNLKLDKQLSDIIIENRQ